jgi:hypothetical protein
VGSAKNIPLDPLTIVRAAARVTLPDLPTLRTAHEAADAARLESIIPTDED